MTIEHIIKELELTTSRNKKIAILEQNKNNEILKEFLFYTYNPYYNFYIKKVPTITLTTPLEAFNFRTVGQSWQEFKKLLNKLRNRELTGNKAIEEVKWFLLTVNKDAYNLYKQVFKKKLAKAGINTKTINKVFKNLIPEFRIQLANEFDPDKLDKYPEYWYVSTKLNGIRAIYLHDKGGLYTRQGHEIIGFEHIEEGCWDMCNRFNLKFLDGELYSNKIDFDTIQSCVMKNKYYSKDIKNNIYFYLFALGECKDTTEMIGILKGISNINIPYIKIIPQRLMKIDLDRLCLAYLNIYKHCEGLMLRHPINYYDWKRSDNLLKFKHFTILKIYEKHKDKVTPNTLRKIKNYLDETSLVLDDFTIIAYTEGQGNCKGMLGSLTIEGKYKGRLIQSNVGSGFDLEQRKELWKIRDELIGKEVVVKCQEITKNSSLRFPVIIQIKLDR